jgi:hypothetical protein
LEDLAFEFATLCTDKHGRSLVSLIEIHKHFNVYQSSPRKAVSTIHDELLYPPMPLQPPSPPPAPTPDDWIYHWLKDELGEDYVRYRPAFVDQGFVKEEDMNFGEVFSDEVLKDVLGVNQLAHRRKIIHKHASLLAKAQAHN